MKKSFSLLSLLLVLFAGSLVTSCEVAKEIANELSGPTNTWCEMYVQYGEDSKVSLTVDAIYVDEEYTGTGASTSKKTRAYLDSSITLQPGITFVITLNSNSENTIIEGLTDKTYIMKTFASDTATTADDSESDDNEDSSFKLKGSKTNWTLLYLAKADLRDEDNQFELPDAPDILTWESIDDGATALTDPSGFSWSKLLKSYLLSTLLDKIE